MRRRFFSGVLLLLAGLLVSAGCVSSDKPFFADATAATPLPDAFVLVTQSDKGTSALRFDRKDDAYLASEDGKVSAYHLYPLSAGADAGRSFFVGMETSDRGSSADYGLVEITGKDLFLHSFEAKELAAQLGVPDDGGDYGATFRTEADLVKVFEAAAADLVKSGTNPDAGRMRIYDMADSAERAEGERLLKEAETSDGDN